MSTATTGTADSRQQQRRRRRPQLYLLPPTVATVAIIDELDAIEVYENEKHVKNKQRRRAFQLYGFCVLLVLFAMEIVQLQKGSGIQTLPTDQKVLETTTMRIYFNITFDKLACIDANVHAMDVTGRRGQEQEQQQQQEQKQPVDELPHDTIIKTRLYCNGTSSELLMMMAMIYMMMMLRRRPHSQHPILLIRTTENRKSIRNLFIPKI